MLSALLVWWGIGLLGWVLLQLFVSGKFTIDSFSRPMKTELRILEAFTLWLVAWAGPVFFIPLCLLCFLEISRSIWIGMFSDKKWNKVIWRD